MAAISCLVWQEKSDAAKKLREDLQGPYAVIQQAARMIAKVTYLKPCFRNSRLPPSLEAAQLLL